MTREKALRKVKGYLTDYIPADNYEEVEEIVEALEQDTSDDAISRQAVLSQTYLWSKDEFLRVTNPFDYLRKKINSLPLVKPQEPKTGYWRAVYQGDEIIDYRCSECEFGNTFGKGTYGMNYCPNCGAKMEVEK